MALKAEAQAKVDRALATLDGLSDDDKREVVRMTYAEGRGDVEEVIIAKRAKLEAINERRAQVDALAEAVGIDLEPAEEPVE